MIAINYCFFINKKSRPNQSPSTEFVDVAPYMRNFPVLPNTLAIVIITYMWTGLIISNDPNTITIKKEKEKNLSRYQMKSLFFFFFFPIFFCHTRTRGWAKRSLTVMPVELAPPRCGYTGEATSLPSVLHLSHKRKHILKRALSVKHPLIHGALSTLTSNGGCMYGPCYH